LCLAAGEMGLSIWSVLQIASTRILCQRRLQNGCPATPATTHGRLLLHHNVQRAASPSPCRYCTFRDHCTTSYPVYRLFLKYDFSSPYKLVKGIVKTKILEILLNCADLSSFLPLVPRKEHWHQKHFNTTTLVRYFSQAMSDKLLDTSPGGENTQSVSPSLSIPPAPFICCCSPCLVCTCMLYECID